MKTTIEPTNESASDIKYNFIKPPERSEWKCYMFGNRSDSTGIVYVPDKGREPNRFVRWMMLICFDCLWVKEEK